MFVGATERRGWKRQGEKNVSFHRARLVEVNQKNSFSN